MVFVGSDGGNLYAFDTAGHTHCSGTPTFCLPLWTGSTASGVDSSPAIANGMVYVGSQDGKLYAFGLPLLMVPCQTQSPGITIEAAPESAGCSVRW